MKYTNKVLGTRVLDLVASVQDRLAGEAGAPSAEDIGELVREIVGGLADEPDAILDALAAYWAMMADS